MKMIIRHVNDDDEDDHVSVEEAPALGAAEVDQEVPVC